MSFQNLLNNYCAYVHLEKLIEFRKSRKIHEAAEDWLDKEIDDLNKQLNGGANHDSRIVN
ncbi:hypothetical protein MHB84_03445 [Paenibacillus sp. FSL F4-0087]|uniref:hypothetical protein n=1 Tax=Paenibacillus sp. FSL F4-0087 TaxID=2921368 RepID=UPI00096D9CA7|nr:hypothetical protein BK122_15835 [Paenibacillus pabuli]